MRSLFNFEAEPFELDTEFDEYEEELDSGFGEFDTELTEEEWQGEINRRNTPAIDAVNVQTLKANIVKIANQEWVRWGRGSIKEGDQNIRSMLEDYWVTGTGRRLSEPGWWSKHPWSAAFISWVMKKAGAGKAFKYSSAHAVYIKAAKGNRLANNNNPFKAYRIREVKPQLGDLVCKSRAGSGANYDNIRPGHKTHCDIVTEVHPSHLITIGGNVRNSVSKTIVPIDANGFINKSGYFAVIRLSAPSRSPEAFLTPPQSTGKPMKDAVAHAAGVRGTQFQIYGGEI